MGIKHMYGLVKCKYINRSFHRYKKSCSIPWAACASLQGKSRTRRSGLSEPCPTRPMPQGSVGVGRPSSVSVVCQSSSDSKSYSNLLYDNHFKIIIYKSARVNILHSRFCPKGQQRSCSQLALLYSYQHRRSLLHPQCQLSLVALR